MGVPVAARVADPVSMPTLPEVVASSLNIMEVRIARSRMAGEPPDVTVAPRLAHLRLLDFHRGKEAIEEGRRAVERVAQTLTLPQLSSVESEAGFSTKSEVKLPQ